MPKRKTKLERNIENGYPAKQMVAKLRRLADCIEQGKRFRIQIASERISIPPDATINIEHEREGVEEEVEFQVSGDQLASNEFASIQCRPRLVETFIL